MNVSRSSNIPFLPFMKDSTTMTTTDRLPMVTPADWVAGPRQGHRSLGVFQGKAILPSAVLPGFEVQVDQFFVSVWT